jgi:hypothetical protein
LRGWALGSAAAFILLGYEPLMKQLLEEKSNTGHKPEVWREEAAHSCQTCQLPQTSVYAKEEGHVGALQWALANSTSVSRRTMYSDNNHLRVH